MMREYPADVPVSQRGGGLLGIVAVLGVLLVLVQGSVYYKSKGSARFLGSERNKVLAQQMAEAGVEANIGDLGRRKTRVRAGLADSPTYLDKALGGGTYTTRLSTVALGAGSSPDTVDLVSTGSVGKGSQTVHARLKLRKTLDTTKVKTAKTVQDTTMTIGTKTVTVAAMTPASMPALTSTPAYTACMASASPSCQICHLPSGSVASRVVLNVSPKSNIAPVHGGHLGDYVTTDGTCNLYVASTKAVPDTTYAYSSQTVFDSTVTIDTLIKVRVLSWK